MVRPDHQKRATETCGNLSATICRPIRSEEKGTDLVECGWFAGRGFSFSPQ